MEIGGQIGSDADAVNADLVRERSGHDHFQRGLWSVGGGGDDGEG